MSDEQPTPVPIEPQPWWVQIACALGPTLVSELGRGVRDALAHRRRMREPCPHGLPGGRLCAPCWALRESDPDDPSEADVMQ